jgi:hypothetical protein
MAQVLQQQTPNDPLQAEEAHGGDSTDSAEETTPFLKRTPMARPTVKSEEELKNDFQKAMEHDITKWVDQTFGKSNKFPDVELSVAALAGIVRTAYLGIVEQPKFVVTSVRPGNVWTIDAKKEVTRSSKAFAPSESSSMQKRLFAYATFTGSRLMLNALFGCVSGVYASRGKLYVENDTGDKITVMPDMFVGFSTDSIWSRNMPKVVLPAKENQPGRVIPVDGNEKTHFSAFMRTRGGTVLEVDLCDVDITFRQHPAERPVQGMGALAYLAESRASAIRTDTATTMENTLSATATTIRGLKKKQKMKARKKNKRKKKKVSN